jgi:hypothetical protein
MAREKVVYKLGVKSWDAINQDGQYICTALHTASNGWEPPAEALDILCYCSKLRHEGNEAAHSTSVEEIRDTIQTHQTGLRKHLEKLFKFVFEVDI